MQRAYGILMLHRRLVRDYEHQPRGSEYGCSMFVGASLGPQLTGALTGLGSGGILLVITTVLVLGVLLALPTLGHQHTP
ncbi:hypothetical protein [Streptomyces sp. SLBN-8D4]|uniref:hypothetical protein n=1 Tax=Streptomyces sp. SLBN-8D4 TaxID=3377728 RepID=UPI003C7DBB9C